MMLKLLNFYFKNFEKKMSILRSRCSASLVKYEEVIVNIVNIVNIDINI